MITTDGDVIGVQYRYDSGAQGLVFLWISYSEVIAQHLIQHGKSLKRTWNSASGN